MRLRVDAVVTPSIGANTNGGMKGKETKAAPRSEGTVVRRPGLFAALFLALPRAVRLRLGAPLLAGGALKRDVVTAPLELELALQLALALQAAMIELSGLHLGADGAARLALVLAITVPATLGELTELGELVERIGL